MLKLYYKILLRGGEILEETKNDWIEKKARLKEFINRDMEKGEQGKADELGLSKTLILVFELDTGSELRFTVGGHIFRSVPEYEWGTLTFQGTRFLKFKSPSGIVEK